MPDILSKSNLFDPILVTDLINKVKGKSSLANLCGNQPLPFNGMKEYTFSMDDEVDLVAENGAKSKGSVSLDATTIIPLKVEYGARISNEFMFASEETQIDILKNFNDGFAKKVARGLDIMAIHGVNPRSKTASALIGNNCFDKALSTITVGDDANALVENAIASLQTNEYDITGMLISPGFRSSLAEIRKADGNPMFPELAWGNAPGTINGLPVQVNSTVSFNNSLDLAIVGDFENSFRWGYAKEIPVKIIEFGDPDNSGNDLQGYNQIYIRAEMFLGWGILDKNAFALIKSESTI